MRRWHPRCNRDIRKTQQAHPEPRRENISHVINMFTKEVLSAQNTNIRLNQKKRREPWFHFRKRRENHDFTWWSPKPAHQRTYILSASPSTRHYDLPITYPTPSEDPPKVFPDTFGRASTERLRWKLQRRSKTSIRRLLRKQMTRRRRRVREKHATSMRRAHEEHATNVERHANYFADSFKIAVRQLTYCGFSLIRTTVYLSIEDVLECL